LATISAFIPSKRNLYQYTWNQESEQGKLRKKYMARKLENICDLDSDPVMPFVDAARLLAAVIRNSRLKPKGRRWNFADKMLVLALMRCNPKCYILLQTLFPFPSTQTLQCVLNTVPVMTGINTHVFGVLDNDDIDAERLRL
jgi:hypothetical protein